MSGAGPIRMSTPDDRVSTGDAGSSVAQVLVTGGTGFIGRRLVDALGRSGARVRVLSRAGDGPGDWHPNVEVVRGDVTDPASLAAAVEGCTSVAHLAGEWRVSSQYWTVNAVGTQNVLSAAQRAGVAHLLHMSSVGVMGGRRPGRIGEAEPCRPANDYELSKFEAERLALLWSGDTGIRVTVLRPTIVFGARPGSPDSLLALLRAIHARRFVYFDRSAAANYVYVDDVAGACLRAIERRTPGVYIVADPCHLAEFVDTAADALQVPRPTRRVPLPIAYAAAATLQSVGWLTRRGSPLTLARVRALSNRAWFESSNIADALGWTPAVGWAAGLARTVAAYRAAGVL